MSDTSRIEVIIGGARPRRFTTEQKLAVTKTVQLSMSISYVACRHGPSRSLVFQWRRLMADGGPGVVVVKKSDLGVELGAAGHFAVKAVTDAFGRGRSDVAGRLVGALKTRGQQNQEGDDGLTTAIGALVDQRAQLRRREDSRPRQEYTTR
jgi:hypothetical protein